MRTLADATDGIAVMDSNDLDKGLRKISDDLTSYYLLGYYSTNAKTRWRLPVAQGPRQTAGRRRSGRGAAIVPRALKKSRGRAPRPRHPPPTPPRRFTPRSGMLASVRPDSPVRLRATVQPGRRSTVDCRRALGCPGTARRVGPGRQRRPAGLGRRRFCQRARGHAKPGDRTFLTSIAWPGSKGTIDLQARVTPAAGGPAVMDSLHLAATPQPLFYRRGPTTANRQVITADLRFTRADRVHLELPVAAAVTPGAGRLLDRTGQPLTVPVTVGERVDDATGQRWITADVALAPLAPADYIIDVAMAGPVGRVARRRRHPGRSLTSGLDRSFR